MSSTFRFGPAVLLIAASTAAGQAPLPTPTPEPTISSSTSAQLDARTRREQALVKMLEGQKQIWKSYRLQTQAGRTNALQLARTALLKAVELDPTLAEAYTALAELAVTMPPVSVDEAIKLAKRSIEANKTNFGAHRMLGRLYTVQSRLNTGTLDRALADLAVAEWTEVTRLDPRNAEAWAFRSAFAEAMNKEKESIDALRGWVSASAPNDVQFYSRIMGGGADLAPESASLKLASALAKAGKTDEATRILSTVIADDAENSEAIGLLAEMVESAEGDVASSVISALQQAVFAKPDNVSLVDMLARLQGRTGQFDEGVSLLKKTIAANSKSDPRAASTLSISLADLFLRQDRYDDALRSLEESLSVRGLTAGVEFSDEDREFAVYVFEKLIHVCKLANRPDAAKAYIERARRSFGKEDLFADRQLVSVLESFGNRKDALALVRHLRTKRPAEAALVRQEASLLTDLGQIDEAVTLVRSRPDGQTAKPGGQTPVPLVPSPADEFSNLLFIANLYSRAARGKQAIETANHAIAIADGTERRQIGRMTLATAQQMSGDYASAEGTLRGVLKEMPGNPMALNNLGYFLTERGERLEEAVAMIQQALKIDPKNPSYLDSLGWAYFRLGNVAEAEKFLTEANRTDPDSMTIYEHLGDLYSRKGDTVRAKRSWNRALVLASGTEWDRLKKKLGQ